MNDADTPLLDISGLTVAFDTSGVRTTPVKAVDLSLSKGEILGVVGESGSGKTMISKAIMRLLPGGGHIAGGSIRLGTTELTTLDAEDMRAVRGRRIGMIFQEPMMSLNPAMRVGRQMQEAFPAELRNDANRTRELMLAMLQRVRMPDPDACLRAYPHEFSGGMRQRIMLATSLLMKPELLIADEPTTALDVLIQKEVLDLMVELVRDLGTSVILISHDLGLIARYADSVCVMRDGMVVENGRTTDILTAPQQSYTRELLQSLPKRSAANDKPRVQQSGEPIVRIDDLQVVFGSRIALPWRKQRITRAVDGVSTTIYPGETVAVVGESGSGKTTLGRAILRLVESQHGSIRIDGQDITRLSHRQVRPLRARMQIVYQDPFSSLDPRMRIEDIVAEAFRLTGLARRKRRDNAVETLAEVGLSEEFLRRFPHELSGGQRQRVSIARAIAMQPDLIVTDEAVSALDVTVQARVLALLSSLQQQHGFAYLFITHDIGVVDQVADRVLVMYQGRVVESGRKDDVLDHPRHPYTCRLLEAVPRLAALSGGGFQSLETRFSAPAPPSGYQHDRRFLGENNTSTQMVEIADGHHVTYSPAVAETRL
jgi:peptide/nickel transport system ATP-binding protein